jgi:hypothetical protein
MTEIHSEVFLEGEKIAERVTEIQTEGRESGLLRRTFAAEISEGDGRTVDSIMPYGEQITHNDGSAAYPRNPTRQWTTILPTK